jgi:hypothetical protein
MKTVGLVCLGIAALAFLFVVTNVATVGSCTSALGTFRLLSLVACLTNGLLLLTLAAVHHAIQVRNDKPSARNAV